MLRRERADQEGDQFQAGAATLDDAGYGATLRGEQNAHSEESANSVLAQCTQTGA